MAEIHFLSKLLIVYLYKMDTPCQPNDVSNLSGSYFTAVLTVKQYYKIKTQL